VDEKLAFIECASADDANKTLNLNGKPFLGSCLKVLEKELYNGGQKRQFFSACCVAVVVTGIFLLLLFIYFIYFIYLFIFYFLFLFIYLFIIIIFLFFLFIYIKQAFMIVVLDHTVTEVI